MLTVQFFDPLTQCQTHLKVGSLLQTMSLRLLSNVDTRKKLLVVPLYDRNSKSQKSLNKNQLYF